MTDVPHSLYDYDPSLYRLIHVGTPGDSDYYREQCYGARAVLELGCGWGRVTRELVSVVDEVVGLDINPGMIEAARDEVPGAAFTVGDMREFDFDARFERIIIPYNSLYNLLTDDDLHACLTAVERHLAEGGMLLFDGYHVSPQMLREMRREGGVDYDVIGTFELDGQSIEVIEHSSYDVPRRRFNADYIYRFHNDDGTSEAVQCHIPQRFLLPGDLQESLAAAGLQLESVTGDFLGEPLEPHHFQMVVEARRL
ncbi:MAG: class I SAM-dependent methyltransferase [Myxococcota bacterium]